MVFWQYHS